MYIMNKSITQKIIRYISGFFTVANAVTENYYRSYYRRAGAY